PGMAVRALITNPFVSLRAHEFDWIGSHLGSRRDVGQRFAIRATEPEFAVGLAIDLIAFLMNRAMVLATEESQVGERGRAAVGPVTDVMALAESYFAAREAEVSRQLGDLVTELIERACFHGESPFY